MAVNLATKYSNKVDERFEKQSQASLVTNNSYDFTGVDTVKVYSIDTVALNNYTRSGANRYGTPSELGNTVQTMQVTQDKGWTFTIDKGNFKQSELVMQAGKACARQIAQVVIPAYDKYVFTQIAKAAYGITEGTGANITHTHADSTSVTKSNAYELFLKGQEALGDALVPDAGRVCLCSYKYANLLKQDPAFMRYGNLSQEMILKGILGEIDGVKIVKVPASRLPAGCNFILTHPMATVAPKQLWEYKIHTDAPGISGWSTAHGQRAA
jgi:N4-gp56 family major capsid protein